MWVTRRVEFTRAGAGMEAFSYPCAVVGNPTGTTWRVRMRVRVATTRRVRTRCHLELWVLFRPRLDRGDFFSLSPSHNLYTHALNINKK